MYKFNKSNTKNILYILTLIIVLCIFYYIFNKLINYNKINNEWLNCYYADPIVFADNLPKYFIQQEQSNLTYMHYPPKKYNIMLKSYLQHLDEKFNPNGLYIVFSPGGTTAAISAFYYAIQYIENKKITIKSAVKPPYYTLHKKLSKYEKNCEWIDDRSKETDIEVIVSPNNPTGELLKPTFTSKYIILDSVYDKSSFSNKKYSVNPWKYELYKNNNFCEVNSFSKYGYAGVRVGYLITSNKKIAEIVSKYFEIKNLGLNAWAMANFEKNIPVFFNDNIKKNNYNLIQKRHNEIRKIIPSKLIYSNRNVPFILIKLPKNIFDKHKIIIRPGEEFAISNDYSRINMMVSNNTWYNIINRISTISFQNDIKIYI